MKRRTVGISTFMSQSEDELRKLARQHWCMLSFLELQKKLEKKSPDWKMRMQSLTLDVMTAASMRPGELEENRRIEILKMIESFPELRSTGFHARFLLLYCNYLLEKRKQYSEAAKAFAECMQLFEKNKLSETEEFAELLIDFSGTLALCGKETGNESEFLQKRFDLAKRACSIYEKLGATKDKENYVVGCVMALGTCSNIEPVDSKSQLLWSEKVLKHCAKGSQQYIFAIKRKAGALEALRRSKEALKYIEEALSYIHEKDEEAAIFYEFLGSALFEHMRFDEAAAAFRTSLEIRVRFYGTESEKVVLSQLGLCWTFSCRQQFAGADDLFRELARRVLLHPTACQPEMTVHFRMLAMYHMEREEYNLCAEFLWKAIQLARLLNDKQPLKKLESELIDILSKLSAEENCMVEEGWTTCIALKRLYQLPCTDKEIFLLFSEGFEEDLTIASEKKDLLTADSLVAVARNPDVAVRKLALKWSGDIDSLKDCEEREVLSMVTQQTN